MHLAASSEAPAARVTRAWGSPEDVPTGTRKHTRLHLSESIRPSVHRIELHDTT